jgi:hypothetical protein
MHLLGCITADAIVGSSQSKYESVLPHDSLPTCNNSRGAERTLFIKFYIVEFY